MELIFKGRKKIDSGHLAPDQFDARRQLGQVCLALEIEGLTHGCHGTFHEWLRLLTAITALKPPHEETAP
jgi:hypothetical protein